MGDAAGSPLKPPGRPRVSGLFPSFRVDTELLAALKVLARYRRRRFILLAAGLRSMLLGRCRFPLELAGCPQLLARTLNCLELPARPQAASGLPFRP